MNNCLYFGTGASSSKNYDDLYISLDAAVTNGIRHFDTAPSYKTEDVLGKIIKELARKNYLSRNDYFIQTKIDPWQMQDGHVRDFVEDAMRKLDVDYLDSLLVHWFEPDYIDDTWNDFQKMYEEGLVKRIGVCNVRERHIKKMLRYDIVPQIVQIERNPLRICEKEISICHENGIEIQAYSALCKMDDRIKNNSVVNGIAQKHKKSVGQTVLRWHLETGVIPIFTSKRPTRIKEYANIFDFDLSDLEVQSISALNINYKIYLESCICPGF